MGRVTVDILGQVEPLVLIGEEDVFVFSLENST